MRRRFWARWSLRTAALALALPQFGRSAVAPVDLPPRKGRGAVRHDMALLGERSRSITVRERSRLRVGWPSTFGGLCSCSPPGEAGGRHIQYHGTLLQSQPALRCGDQVVIIAATSSSVTLS